MKLVQAVVGTALAWSLAAPTHAEGEVSQVAKDHLAMAAS